MNVSLQDIIRCIQPIQVIGSVDRTISEVVTTDAVSKSGDLFWCSDKNKESLREVKSGVGIISKETFDFLGSIGLHESSVVWLVVARPRYAFMQVLKLIADAAFVPGTIASSAKIHPSVKLDQSTIWIGENVVIEDGVEIGSFVRIDHNTVIKANTKIGQHVVIGSNCTIGGVGFGYEPNENGIYELMPHIGNVVLSDYVEIGNNTCIDRAVIGSTFLHEHVKVDNLVHIAHGVQVGKNSLVIAHAMVAGGVKIGENCWIAPSSSIIQKVAVGDNSVVGMGSVVIKPVDPNTVVAGSPAKKLKDK